MQTTKNAIDVLKKEMLQDQIITTYDTLNLQKDLEMLLPGLVSLCQNSPSFLHVCLTGYNFRKTLIHLEIG